MENNIVYQKALQFSRLLIDCLKDLDFPSYNHVFYQLRRSGTAIGASIAEADSAQSMADFVNKMKVADKEANETTYWLSLLEKDFPEIPEKLKEHIREIKRILRSILITCDRRRKERT
jgi:four helix bundle protein